MQYEKITSDIAAPNIYHFITTISKSSMRSAVVNWFTAKQRPKLNIPEELLGVDVIKLTTDSADANDYLEEIFMVHAHNDPSIKEFELVSPSKDTLVYAIERIDDKVLMLYKVASDSTLAPLKMTDKFVLTNGMIKNYISPTEVITDVGKFYLNQLLLVEPFGDLFSYINEPFDTGKLDDQVAQAILDKKVTREMYNKYMNNGYWYGQDGSIATPTWSEKSLTTDPKIKKRKAELLEEYKDRLDDPTILSVIEQELIQMDKDFIKGDTSEIFYNVTSGKSYGEQRKKFFLMVGMSPAFSNESNKYEFVADSLSDGWNAKTIAVGANEIRRGSYGRGIDTAKGGEQTKFILRIFQNVGITSDDCKSNKGATIFFTEHNYKAYLQRYLMNGTLLTEENIKSYIGKEVTIRAPQYCKTEDGFCYVCCGKLFEQLGMKAIGMNTVLVSSRIVSISMKSLHKSSVESTTINDLSPYLLTV